MLNALRSLATSRFVWCLLACNSVLNDVSAANSLPSILWYILGKLALTVFIPADHDAPWLLYYCTAKLAVSLLITLPFATAMYAAWAAVKSVLKPKEPLAA